MEKILRPEQKLATLGELLLRFNFKAHPPPPPPPPHPPPAPHPTIKM